MSKINLTINAESAEELREILASLPLGTSVSVQNTTDPHASPVPVNQAPVNTPPQPQAAQQAPAVPVAPSPAAPVQPNPAPAPTTNQAAPLVPTNAPGYTFEQLAAAAAPLMDAGKGPQLIETLHAFGVDALTALAPEQYGAFAVKMRELGAKI